MIHKSLDELHPRFREIAKTWLHIVTEDLSLDVRITETFRDLRRQKAVLASGKSTVSFGFHNIGLAFDFACSENGIYITNGAHPYYLKCGLVGEALGCIWGGRFDISPAVPGQQPDSGHLEWHPGMTLAQARAAYETGTNPHDLIRTA